MTDGTTGFQVAPVSQEQDMGRVRELFNSAVDAMIQATELAKVVEQLKRDVGELQYSMENLRRRNSELDSLIADVRGQRDKATEEASSLRHELEETRHSLANSTSSSEGLREVNTALLEDLRLTQKDRDGAILEAIFLREELDKANTKLADIEALAQNMFGLAKPKPEEPPTTYPTPTPIPDFSPHPIQGVDDSNAPSDTRPWWEKDAATR